MNPNSRIPSRRPTTAGYSFIAALTLFAGLQAEEPKAGRGPDQLVEIVGTHNTFRLTPWLYSGSQPETEAAFAALQKLGIKTIVSVDGSKPDVETAQKYGLRYIHLPVGYDGISHERAVELAKVSQTITGPIYVHCHHGLHRGPTAAAVMCMAREDWTSERAETWLREAGTAVDYQGLFQSVRNYRAATAEELARVPADFPSISPVPPLVDVMVAIDEALDILKTAQKADWQTPKEHPDIALPHEALMINEHFRELLRGEDAVKRPPDYLEKLRGAEEASAALHQQLRALAAGNAEARPALEVAWTRATQSCGACHKAYRNKK